MSWTTRPTLLLRVKQGDSIGWHEFYDTYKGLIFHAGASGGGIPNNDPDELLQRVMLAVYHDGKFSYDPVKGKFRAWLKTIVRNTKNGLLRDVYRERERIGGSDTAPEGDDDSSPAHDVPVDPFDTLWDTEWQKHLKHQALEQLRLEVEPATYQAFDLAILQERPSSEVARIAGMTVSNVDVCKCRCRKRLRLILRNLEDNC